jgi:hypothetical protein
VEEIGVKSNKGNPAAGLGNQVIKNAIFIKKRATKLWLLFFSSKLTDEF